MANLLAKLLSIGSDKPLKEFNKTVDRINDIADTYEHMDDTELQAQTAHFKERIENGEELDDLLPEAFATVREASSRVLGMRHFDVQLVGGMALHRGMIAEMRTGEGKTLVSTLAGYLNALSGKGVHLVTVNDYLAKRDSEWMGKLYNFLGMEVGLLQNGQNLDLKPAAYAADITYGTNSEFGFDYLRDNMVTRLQDRSQRGHNFAIVDEVDSILIDEARTPLIISGAGSKSASTYQDFARAVRGLSADVDYELDEAKHTITATETGLHKIEERLGIENIYSDMSGQLANYLQQALKAQYMFHRDKQYVVQAGEVKIVDEFTGRIMEGRRYSEGLHQAIEAKEGVKIREENQTLATITLQNYFRLYDKLSGMTGTAVTESQEFREIYGLDVQEIPTNKPIAREDHDDLVYADVEHKFQAVADDVEQRHEQGQPVLVGTVSIESSEKLSRILDKRGIKHEVLNAKHHEREAQIVAQAGREGAVTIATNMAGRGTDILLGGNPDVLSEQLLAEEGIDPEEATDQQKLAALDEAKATCALEREHVVDAGGLCVIGTERHESRRIDNQLRGRSGRQGDPGETQFYLSLQDDLMRLFGGDRMDKIRDMMHKAEMPEDMPIQAKIVTKAVETAQRKIEEINFGSRKNVLDYDDVMNLQRQTIYEERNDILDGKDMAQRFGDIAEHVVERAMSLYCDENELAENWDFEGLENWLQDLTGRQDTPEFSDEIEYDELAEQITAYIMDIFHERSEEFGDELVQEIAAQVMLRVMDARWMDYLEEMDYLKTGIGLRGFGQRDPLVEYKNEARAAFSELINTMYTDFMRTILRIEVRQAQEENPQEQKSFSRASYSGPADIDGDQGANSVLRQQAQAQAAEGQETAQQHKTYRKDEDSDPYVGVGRNEPCPCGSGKKFKNCHGRNR